MEFYDDKDLAYWRRQADGGKAIIIEIPARMLLDLEIESLSQEKTREVSTEDLTAWIDENREEIEKALDQETKEKAAVEKLERKLYDKNDKNGEEPAKEKPEAVQLPYHDGSETITRIMAREVFSDEQIAVIGEAMLEGLPDKYLLCFLKKEYTPAVMRQLKDYVTKLYREEVSGANGSKP